MSPTKPMSPVNKSSYPSSPRKGSEPSKSAANYPSSPRKGSEPSKSAANYPSSPRKGSEPSKSAANYPSSPRKGSEPSKSLANIANARNSPASTESGAKSDSTDSKCEKEAVALCLSSEETTAPEDGDDEFSLKESSSMEPPEAMEDDARSEVGIRQNIWGCANFSLPGICSELALTDACHEADY